MNNCFKLNKFAALAACVLFSVLTACSGQSGKPTIVLIGEDSSSLQAMEALKGSFEKQHNISVKFIRDPFDAALQKANQDLANKSGQYDIICEYAASLAPYVNNNYVYTLDEMQRFVPATEVPRTFESDLFPGVWRETGFFRRQGTTTPIRVSYPFAATTMILVYNKRLFGDSALQKRFETRYHRPLSVPTTWEEYLPLAEFFTDPRSGTFGVSIEGAPGGYLYWEWANYAYGMGGGVMKKSAGWDGDENTPLILTSKETVAATKLFIALKKYNAGDFFSVGSAEKREIFLTKPVAMSIMWSDYIPQMLANPMAKDLGFAPIPGDKSMLGGATFFLNRSSKHPKEATQYILSLMDHDMQVQLMERGLASPFKSPYNDAKIKTIPYSAAIRDSLDRGVYMIESGPESQLVQDVVTDRLQAMWRGTTDIESGLRSAQEEIQQKRILLYRKVRAQ